ncbi:MAG: hypothetical protein JXA68_05070 [Ignavibacteriales bacterium]|nr:hypothetical protein [Ignavibacteriales bacterium]
MQIENIELVVIKLEKHIKSEDYKGYDPYDLLNSPIFKLPILKSTKLIRFFSQQVFRRLFFNIRPLLGIKKEVNPVTLGLCIQAYTYLSIIYEDKKDFYLQEIKYCIQKLIELKSIGYSGFCWGYNFDWEARYTKIDKFVPTIVATGIITNGLFEYYKVYKDEKVKDILANSAEFVLNDLNRYYENENFCFSYSPKDNQKVYNATMKGARLLSQVYSITKDQKLLSEAENTVKFVIKNQNADGSWFYSKNDARKWVDNFHTAYVLDALDEFITLSGKNEYKKNLDLGIKYYLKNLFTEEGYPKYYSNSFYPIDSTEVAQSIITLTRFGFLERAEKVIKFTIDNLYSDKGYFYYQKNRIYKHKTIYPRWSISYLLISLSYFLFSKNYEKNKNF